MDQDFTGYRLDLEDRVAVEADAIPFACASEESEAELPDVVDPEVWGMVLDNQFSMGSCGGHAGSNAAESLLYWEHNVVQPMSRLYCYLRAQQFCGLFGSDQGTTIEAVRKALQEGIPEEKFCPYPANAAYPGRNWRPSAEAVENAKQYRIGSYISIKRQPNPWAGALDWLGNYGAALMGIRWPVEMDSNGVVRRFRAGQSGHAILANGYVWDFDRRGQRIIKVANSHGARSGRNGWIYFTQDAWMDCMADQYTVALGVTSLSSPKRNPRVWDGLKPLMVRFHKSLI